MNRMFSCLGLIAAVSLWFPASALATDTEIQLGDQFQGLVRDVLDEDRLRFTDLEGTEVSATVKGNDGLLPTLRLWDVSGSQFLDVASFLRGAGTSKVSLSKFPLPAEGDYEFVIGGTGASLATYKVTTKRKEAKANRKVKAEDELANAKDTFLQEFNALGGSEVTIKVTSINPKWDPTIDLLEDPNENPIDLTGLVEEKNGAVQIRKLELPATTGAYVVRIASRDGGFGAFKVDISVKAAKSKNKLEESASPGITEVIGDGFEIGTVDIAFILSSFTAGTFDLNAFYEDPKNPGTFLPATVTNVPVVPAGGASLVGLESSQIGVAHMARWSVRTDLGAVMESGVVFRLEVIGGGQDDSEPFSINTQGTFVEVANGLNSARAFHSSNLLPNGTLLVAGGLGAHAGGSHEIGDFSGGGSSATFTETHSSLAVPRQNQTSVSLSSAAGDLVVLVGGQDPLGSDAPLSSSESFDPLTGTFTATGNNQATRLFSGTAATLDDRVATFGSDDDGVGGMFNSGEVLDNNQTLWTLLGPMSIGRTGASATRLADGRVLIAGGSGVAATAAEIFDSATSAYTAVGAMVVERSFHSAQRLVDGRVLILGGVDTTGNPTASAEIFDPVTNTFSAASEDMQTPRAGLSSVRLTDGRVLIAGGRIDNTGLTTDEVELFRPGTNDFTPAGTLALARQQHTMSALADGRVVVVGGVDSDPGAVPLPSVEIRSPQNGATNTPPSVMSITNPGASSGNVSISYILADGEDESAEVTVRWRIAAGLWRQTTPGSGGDGFSGLTTSLAGTAHSFVWDSLADTGASFANTVEIEITPFGAVPGTSMTTTFSLTN